VEGVEAVAASLSIELSFVPARLTDALLFLERLILGTEDILSSLSRELLFRPTKKENVQDLVAAEDILPPDIFIAGCDLSENGPWEDGSQLCYVIR
jgi:hypothetical protein